MKRIKYKIPKFFYRVFVIPLFLMLLCASCASIVIREHVKISSDDWLMANGNPQKDNISISADPVKIPPALVWDFNVDAGFHNNVFSIADAVLFASTLRGEIFAIDVSSGKRLGYISKLGGSVFGSPIVRERSIIFTIDGNEDRSVVSYDFSKGTTNWEFNAGFIRSSPIVLNDNVIVANKSGLVFSINALSGEKNWVFNSGTKISFFTSPASDGKNIYLGNTSGELFAINLVTGNLQWRLETGSSFFCNISIHNDTLFTGCNDGIFRAFTNEGAIIWEKKLNTKFSSSSTFFNQSIITTGVNGKVYSLKTQTGENIWEFKTNGAITASPVLAGEYVFIGSFDKNFYCLNAKTGKEIWRFETEGRIKATALVWRGFVFVASDDKTIYCFK
ncbi:MAG: PQQ-binding-like beta-propeller repeat protein [Ignavibacteria bacterium]|nr:MAG: hypothetical protein EDM69_10045 [Chlorobiota bacterium]MBV6397873.1 Outer membrane protein assembly factor BamB [Ignavibacteria bacterium]MCC6886820.1 PQQ-binding-like beta-propeller repeat protein [Ignavibacteriales bacterium]MCE7953944.1 hypothetical protein [Chlorobi bacterium CHB7]RIK47549.1 MAG: hypothetical protein DCC60_10355 [Ignavibacteriota bacterium]